MISKNVSLTGEAGKIYIDDYEEDILEMLVKSPNTGKFRMATFCISRLEARCLIELLEEYVEYRDSHPQKVMQ